RGKADRDLYQVSQWRQATPLAEGRAMHRQDAGATTRSKAGARGVTRSTEVAGGEALGLTGESGLAQARLAGDHEHARRTAVNDLGDPAGHAPHLGPAPDERRLVAQTRPGAGRVEQAEQLERLDRVALALQPQRAQRPPGGEPSRGRRRVRPGVDRTDRGSV